MIEQRMAEALEQSGLDAVVASSRENVLYLSGVRNMSHDLIPSRHTFVVWPREGDPTYVVIASEEGTARLETRIKDIRTYTEFAVAPAALLAQVLREKDLAGKRLGIEQRGLTLDIDETLRQSLPQATLQPIDGFFDRLRMIKTEVEVGLLTGATQVTERAIRAAFAAARPGDTERSISNAIARHLHDGGADNVAWIVLGAGPNAAIVHPKPGPYQIRDGDIVRVDLGAWFTGYLSDLGRTAVVGRPSDQQRAYYAKLRRAEDAVLAAIRPGRPVKDLYHACMDTLRQGQPSVVLPSFPHIGHGIGVGLHEFPMITADAEQRLVPNMVLCVEPAFLDTEGRMYHIEETVRVTETGVEVLTLRDPWAEVFVIA